MRIDGYLLAALGCRKDIGGGISRRRSDLAVARQLFATREELGTLALDRAGARLLCAHEIADVRFRGRELIGCDLGVAPRALGGGKPLVGLFAPALGVGALRENVALRALRRDELLVQPRSHRGELRGGVALGALPRVDDAREARQHEQTARRDHRARTEGPRRGERGRVVRRDEDRDAVRDTPAALRRGRVEGRAGCDRDRAAESRPYDVGRRDALVQPRESLWQRGQLVGVLACRELGIRALDGFAERRGLPAHEREVAIDPLKLVPRRARALGGALRDACGFGDFLARTHEVRSDAASFALALGPFFREARGGRRKLLVSREERSFLVAEATLVALPHEMRALRLDTGGTCLCQSYPRS